MTSMKGSNANKQNLATSQNFLYSSFVLFGLCQLLPWNLYIKSVPYFRVHLSNSHWSQDIASYISSAYTTANFIGIVILVLLRWDERFLGAKGRALSGMTANLISLTLMGIISLLEFPSLTLVISLGVLCAFSGLGVSFMTKGLFNIVACLPPKLTPPLFGGQAIAGLLVSLINVFSLLMNRTQSQVPGSQVTAAYFFIGSGIMVIAIIVFSICFFGKRNSQTDNGETEERLGLGLGKKTGWNEMIEVWWRILPFALGITSTMAATIAVFATFITLPRTFTSSRFWSLFYSPFIFVSFDIGDLMGRTLPTIKCLLPTHGSKLLLSSPWLRWIIFLPLFLVFSPAGMTSLSLSTPSTSSFKIVDIIYFAVCFVFGISNGYVCTVLLMQAPLAASPRCVEIIPQESEMSSEQVVDTELPSHTNNIAQKEIAGSLMGLFLNLGLVLGAVCSFCFRRLIITA